MTLTRRLTLIESTCAQEATECALKVAFASTDRKHVDQHFGSARAFAIFEVNGEGARFLEVIEFAPENQDGNEDKLAGRIEALTCCAAVYVKAIGASAIHQLRAKGVQPLKVAPGTPIAAQLALLAVDLSTDPPAWARRTRTKDADPSRFDVMASEAWDE